MEPRTFPTLAHPPLDTNSHVSAHHTHSFSFDPTTLASPLGQVRQSSDRSLSSVLGHHLAQSCAIAGRNNPPHPLSPSLSKDKGGSFETRRQWWTSLSPRLYLRGFIKRKLGNWEIEQRFRLKMIEYLLCVTGRRRKEEEEERRRRRRSECGALELAITSTIHHVESLGYWVCGARVSPSYIAVLHPAVLPPLPSPSTRGSVPLPSPPPPVRRRAAPPKTDCCASSRSFLFFFNPNFLIQNWIRLLIRNCNRFGRTTQWIYITFDFFFFLILNSSFLLAREIESSNDYQREWKESTITVIGRGMENFK